MDLFEEIVKMRRAGQRGALATIVHTNGAIPSYESSRMLGREDGSIEGTIGGGERRARGGVCYCRGGRPRGVCEQRAIPDGAGTFHRLPASLREDPAERRRLPGDRYART